MPKVIQQAIGNVGADPEKGDTSVGPVVRFSLAVTRSYPDMGQDNGETRWLSIAVFKDSIRKQVLASIRKGMAVGVEGVITQSTYNGKPQWSMKASRVGKLEWFVPSAEDRAAAAERFAKVKEENSEAGSDW